MDPRLLDAAKSADVKGIKQLAKEDPNLLFGTTPQGNTALHLSVNLRHEDLTRELCATCPPLLLGIANQLGETPLHLAAMSGHLPIAKLLVEKVKSSPTPLRWADEKGKWVECPVLRMTKWNGDTALHEAVRNCHTDVVRVLWEADPEQSRVVNNNGESLLYLSVLRKLREMVKCLLDDPSTPHRGPAGDTALHAAVAVGDLDTAKLLLETRPGLIKQQNRYGNTPLHYVALMEKREFVQILVDKIPSVAYVLNSDGFSPVHIAAGLGHVHILKELIQRCSDSGSILSEPRRNANLDSKNVSAAPMRNMQSDSVPSEGMKNAPSSSIDEPSECVKSDLAVSSGVDLDVPSYSKNAPRGASNSTSTDNGDAIASARKSGSFTSKQSLSEVAKNILHIAIECGKLKIVEYILKAPELRGIINQPDGKGNLPLHLAALKCNSKIVRVLLNDRRVERTALNHRGETALQLFYSNVEPTITMQWNETLLLLTDAIPNDNSLLKRDDAQTKLMEKVSEEIKSLARAYANNTTIVSVLMATVTFAAAFTVPGGYISDSGSHPGRPILLGKAAFKLFLISNTIALCTSLAVSFLYISASKGDVEFFLHYREFTRWLMWIAFITMALAFASGMYTVVAPGSLWLAVVICVLCGCLPCLTGILYRWPGAIHIRPQKGSPLDLAQML